MKEVSDEQASFLLGCFNVSSGLFQCWKCGINISSRKEMLFGVIKTMKKEHLLQRQKSPPKANFKPSIESDLHQKGAIISI